MDKRSTTAAKGAAILLVLVHHLFGSDPAWGPWFVAGVLAKAAVAMFVLLSGYALTESWKTRQPSVPRFYKTRAARLYSIYWPVWIVFVPLNLLILRRSLESLYGPGNWPAHMAAEFLGVHDLFGVSGGTNITWWFMSLMLLLTMLFPLLRWLVARGGILVPIAIYATTIAGVFVLLDAYIAPVTLASPLGMLSAFALGIWLSLSPRVPRLLGEMRKQPSVALLGAILIGYLAVGLRSTSARPWEHDVLLAVPLVVLVWLISEHVPVIEKALVAFGVVSFEIFLTHTFLYYYWLHDWFYSLGYPFLIFAAVAIASLVLGWVIHLTLQFAWRRSGLLGSAE